MAVPSVKTIIVPNKSRKNIIGDNSHFFLSLMKTKNSNKIDILLKINLKNCLIKSFI